MGISKQKIFTLVDRGSDQPVLKRFIALGSMQLHTSDMTFWLIDVLGYTRYSANYLSAIKT